MHLWESYLQAVLYSVGSKTSDRTSEISVGYITGRSPVDGSGL